MTRWIFRSTRTIWDLILSSRSQASNQAVAPEIQKSVLNNSVSADELDKELLSQLHSATLQMSESCFELKKLCATVLVPIGTLVSVFSQKQLDLAVFSTAFLVIGFFWIADSTSYYYQRKIRYAMQAIWERRAARCEEPWEVPRISAPSVLKSSINGSMAFYALISIPVIIGAILYITGIIGEPNKTP